MLQALRGQNLLGVDAGSSEPALRRFCKKIKAAELKACEHYYGRRCGDPYPYADQLRLIAFADPILERDIMWCSTSRRGSRSSPASGLFDCYPCRWTDFCPCCNYRERVKVRRAALEPCFRGKRLLELTLAAHGLRNFSHEDPEIAAVECAEIARYLERTIGSLVWVPSKPKPRKPVAGALIFHEVTITSLDPLGLYPHVHAIIELRQGQSESSVAALCTTRLRFSLRHHGLEPYVHTKILDEGNALSILHYATKPFDLVTPYRAATRQANVDYAMVNKNLKSAVEFCEGYFRENGLRRMSARGIFRGSANGFAGLLRSEVGKTELADCRNKLTGVRLTG